MMHKYRKKKYYYLVVLEDLDYEMIKFSCWDLYTVDKEPSHDELVDYQCCLRVVEEIATGIKSYILPYSYDFSTPMVGYKAYTTEEMSMELSDIKYKHNQELY